MDVVRLKLFVTGQTSKSVRAITNLRRLCLESIFGEYELKIIDILEQPQQAEDEKILATPTLIKEFPHPVRRVIGDLTDSDKVLMSLDLPVFQDLTHKQGENNE